MSQRLIFNGINGATGDYLNPFGTAQEIAEHARREIWDKDRVGTLTHALARKRRGALFPELGVDVDDLSQTGWGVIFAENVDPAIREALAPLLSHRKAMAGRRHENYYREFIGEAAYKNGESKRDFLVSRGANALGPVKPRNMPYYLLIVGDPEQIPLQFQYELDIDYAVGRIHFDKVDDYANYAQSVVNAERGMYSTNRRAAFFGVRNQQDHMTDLSSRYLVEPLARSISAEVAGWSVESILGDQTTKAKLGDLLGGEATPAFLFSASHGLAYSNGDPRKVLEQGALVCHEWPGRDAWQGPIPKEFYFAASDIGDQARLGGLIVFQFACYSAGTPNTNDFPYQTQNDFPYQTQDEGAEASDRAFIAALPKKLLSHPRGGALACIGHIDMAWGCSFLDYKYATSQLNVYEDCIKRILGGMPIGSAMEGFNIRYTASSAELLNKMRESESDDSPESEKINQEIADLWMVAHDARNYVIIGDPAVRLPKL